MPELLPYLLIREAGLPYAAVRGLRAPRATAAADRADRLRAAITRLSAGLPEAIGEVVPRMGTADRRAALDLRRALFNGRPVPDPPDLPLPVGVRRRVERIGRLWREHARAEEEGTRALTAELAASREHLLACAGEELLRGVQLSGEGILDSLARYPRPPRPLGKRDRKTERTLVGYLTRMALKPSPFGSFTRLRLALPHGRSHPGGITRVTRLNRLLALWLERALVRHPQTRRHAVLRLNATARISDGRVRYFARGADGTAALIRGERFAAMPLTPPVGVLIEALGGGTVPYGSLLDTAPAEQREAWETLIERLIRAGLLECDLDVPDQTPEVFDLLADLAGRMEGTAAGTARRAALGLAAVERAFGELPVSGRAEALARVRAIVREAASELEFPPPDVGRTLIFEDVGGGEPVRMDTGRWASSLPDLEALRGLLPLFSDTLPGQVALAELFRQRFSGPVDLIDMYEWYRGLSPGELDAPIREGAGGLGVVRALRAELFDHLRGRLDAEEITLDRDLVAGLSARVPPGLDRWRYLSWNVQRARGGRIVVNGAGMGYGRQFARFAALFGNDGGNPLVRALGAAYADDDPLPVDVLGTFGINVNLHPVTLPGAVVYPGSRGSGLSPRDCFARYDSRLGRILVHAKPLGRDVLLVPQNPLFPVLAPPFFQMLARLGPGEGSTLPIWDRFHATRPHAGPCRYPRLILGSAVIQRRTWKLPAATVPDASGPDFAAFAAMRRWQREIGLPDTVFARRHTLADPLDSGSSYSYRIELAAMRLGRAPDRKPQFVDFTSPLTLPALTVLAREAEGEITVQECLPGVGNGRAREYVLETFHGTGRNT